MTELTAKTYTDGLCVEDAEGGVWWPAEDTAAKIAAAEHPETEAVRLCEAGAPGTWRQ